MSTINEQIGKKIKELRVEKGLTQTEFANLFNLTQNAVTNIETGKRTLYYEELLSMANYFDVSTDYLIKENGVRDKKPEKQYICDYTGLDDNTIEKLRLYCTVNNALLEDTETDEMDKKYEIINTSENRAIINGFILSPAFDNVVNAISNVRHVNVVFLSVIAIFLGEYDYFRQLMHLDENDSTIMSLRYLAHEYENAPIHFALNNNIDLFTFQCQKELLKYFDEISALSKLGEAQTTFDLMLYAVFNAIDTIFSNCCDINAFEEKIKEYRIDENQESIKKLKIIYERMKKGVNNG